jgi:rhodanese-related sulfurtransferase
MTPEALAPDRVMPDLPPAAVMQRLRQADGREWAFLDVREAGEAADGHPFGSVNLPYSRLERDIAQMVPRPATPIILIDSGNGVADRAARALRRVGWRDVTVTRGGIPVWEAAGLPLFKGVHTWSKAFGEWVQHHFAPPEISPADLARAMAGPNPPALVDGRPLNEHQLFTLPGAQSCPNAELPLRLSAMVEDGREVIVHCAGRTRSIIGAQTVRDFGLPVRVVALRDGTQGWELAGYRRAGKADRPAAPTPEADGLEVAKARARAVMRQHSLPEVSAQTVATWLQGDLTTYRLDPRPIDEDSPPAGFRRAPGTTLIQQIDQFVAVKGARVVLWDPLLVRAVFAALWLRRMGIDAFVQTDAPPRDDPHPPATVSLRALPQLSASQFAAHVAAGGTVIDIRPSADWRGWRLANGKRALRPSLTTMPLHVGAPVALLAHDETLARLAAIDLADAGHAVAGVCTAASQDLSAAGLALDTAPPVGGWQATDLLDEIQFCAGRHSGNLDDARTYLDWETGLVARLQACDLMPWPTPFATPELPLKETGHVR